MQWYNAWTPREVLDYLEEHFLTVVDAKDGAFIKRHPEYPASADVVSRVLPHLKANREAILDHFRGMAARAWDGPTPGPCPHLPPGEGRRALFGAMRFVAVSLGGRVAWLDGYTKATGFVDDRDSQFRPSVTRAAVLDAGGGVWIEWTDVPGPHPPKGREPPPKPPRRWNPWLDEKPAAADFDGLPD